MDQMKKNLSKCRRKRIYLSIKVKSLQFDLYLHINVPLYKPSSHSNVLFHFQLHVSIISHLRIIYVYNKNNVLIKMLFLFDYLFYFIRKKHFISIKMENL